MALSDFLSEGKPIPAGSGVVASTSQTAIPDWYTNYAMQLLSNQNAIAQTPYATFQGPRVAGFTQPQQQAFQQTGQAAQAYQPALTQATQATQGALAAPGALSAAQPYIAQAGQSTPQVMSQYMNPYTEQVAKRFGDLGVRTLNEQLLPGIQDSMIRAGQFGGTRQAELMGRALRDTSESIGAQQAQLLQQGFGQQQQAAQTDLSRLGGLGSTVGNLAQTQNQQQLAGAGQLAELGGLAQKYGLEGASAMGQIGQQQQALNQANLDTAYADFLRQQGYPQEQINNMLNTFKGAATGVPTGKEEYGIQPLGYQQQYQPSTAAQIGSTVAGIGGILNKLGVL